MGYKPLKGRNNAILFCLIFREIHSTLYIVNVQLIFIHWLIGWPVDYICTISLASILCFTTVIKMSLNTMKGAPLQLPSARLLANVKLLLLFKLK